jgi:hypothetical protein
VRKSTGLAEASDRINVRALGLNQPPRTHGTAAKLIKRRGRVPACSAASDALAVMSRVATAPAAESELFNPSKAPSAAGARDHAEVLGIYIWAEEGCARKMGFSKFIVLKQLKSRTRRSVEVE